MLTRLSRGLRVFVAALAPACLVALPLLADSRTGAKGLPTRLTDQEFWRLSADLSEHDGTFRSDNLVSNELWLQHVIPDLLKTMEPGRVYVGVGPEQNFTFIAALKPAMAFIIDIRRGNLDLQLMYKALFEISSDRAEFVSRLFSRTRPEGLTEQSTAVEMFAAFKDVDRSQALHDETLSVHQTSARRHARVRASQRTIGRGLSTRWTRSRRSDRGSTICRPARIRTAGVPCRRTPIS